MKMVIFRELVKASKKRPFVESILATSALLGVGWFRLEEGHAEIHFFATGNKGGQS